MLPTFFAFARDGRQTLTTAKYTGRIKVYAPTLARSSSRLVINTMITKREASSTQNTPRNFKNGQVIDLTLEEFPVRPSPRNKQLGKAIAAETIDLTFDLPAKEMSSGKEGISSLGLCKRLEPIDRRKRRWVEESPEPSKRQKTVPEDLFGSASSERLRQIFEDDIAQAKQASKGTSAKSASSKSTPPTSLTFCKQADKLADSTQRTAPHKSFPFSGFSALSSTLTPKGSEATPTAASQATPTPRPKVAEATPAARLKLPESSSLSRNETLRRGLLDPSRFVSNSPDPPSTAMPTASKHSKSKRMDREECTPRRESRKQPAPASTSSLLSRQKGNQEKNPEPVGQVFDEIRRFVEQNPVLFPPVNHLSADQSRTSKSATSADTTTQTTPRTRPAMKTATPRKDSSQTKSFLPSPSQSTQDSGDDSEAEPETARTSLASVPSKPPHLPKETETYREKIAKHRQKVTDFSSVARKSVVRKSCRDVDKTQEQLIRELVNERNENAILRREIIKERDSREKAELDRIADKKKYQKQAEQSKSRIEKLEMELKMLKASHATKEKELLAENIQLLQKEVEKSPYAPKTKLPGLRVSTSGDFCIEDGSPSPTESSLTELSFSSDRDSPLSIQAEVEQASPEPDHGYNIKDPFAAAGGPAPYDFSSYTRQTPKPAEEEDAKIIFEQLRVPIPNKSESRRKGKPKKWSTSPPPRAGWRKSSSLLDFTRLMKVHLHRQVDMTTQRVQWQAENISRKPASPETGGQRRIKAERQALADRVQEREEIQRKLAKVLSLPEPTSLVPVFKDGVLAFREGAIVSLPWCFIIE